MIEPAIPLVIPVKKLMNGLSLDCLIAGSVEFPISETLISFLFVSVAGVVVAAVSEFVSDTLPTAF